MKKFSIKEIVPGTYFSEPVYLDGNFILTAPELEFSPELAAALKTWEFKEVFCDGETRQEYSEEGRSIEKEVSEASDGEQLRDAQKFYESLLKFTENLFTLIIIKKEFHFSQIAERVKELCDISRESRRYLLRIMKSSAENQNYLASHSLKSTILAVIIGSYLKLPPHRLIELGVAALLHEAGMSKLPSQCYMNNRALTPQEQKLILGHPVLSYNILKSYDFPLSVSLAALEHHERENGSGYPQKLTGDKISLYAKIIAVACSYEALTGSRPHKDAKDGYEGMLDLLKNEGRQYDDTIVKALVFSLSIYPIGLYVLLSNGKKGQVVDVNPENPRYPMVQVLGELTPDGRNKIIETAPGGVSIDRPLQKEEIP